MKKSILALAIGTAFLAGCSATLPVQAGGMIEKHEGKRVSTTVSTVNFLGFNPMDLKTSEKALAKLQEECGGGKVTGVTALVKQTIFPFVSIHELQTSGYCAQ